MKNKILFVDGCNLLFQMFFGMPSRITAKDGTGIWGVLGFTGALLKIIRSISPWQAMPRTKSKTVCSGVTAMEVLRSIGL